MIGGFMTEFGELQIETGRQKRSEEDRDGPIVVAGVSGWPSGATPGDAFRLTVEVVQVVERTTKIGDPCYFLNCRDARGTRLSVVVWDWQMERFRGQAEEGRTATLDVRVPKEGF